MGKQTISTKELRKGSNILIRMRDKAIQQFHETRAQIPPKLQKFYDYENMLAHVLEHGRPQANRTGVGTIGIHGYQLRFNLDNGFPLLTTKKLFTKAIIHELLWFIKGDTNIRYLDENGVRIWDDWPYEKYKNSEAFAGESMKEFAVKIAEDPVFAKKWGELGPVYGAQWRDWHYVDAEGNQQSLDQLSQLITLLEKQQETGVINRRAIISAWNAPQIPHMALPPCHCLFQLHSGLMSIDERRQYWALKNDKDISWSSNMDDDELDAAGAPFLRLDLQLYQRSCDIFLGVPFNIASYSLLLMMLAQVTNMKPGTFIHDYGDLHIYDNHFDQVVLQLTREPFPYPTMKIANRGQDIFGFRFDDFSLHNYQCHPSIAADVAV